MPALGRLRQEDPEFEGYKMSKASLFHIALILSHYGWKGRGEEKRREGKSPESCDVTTLLPLGLEQVSLPTSLFLSSAVLFSEVPVHTSSLPCPYQGFYPVTGVL